MGGIIFPPDGVILRPPPVRVLGQEKKITDISKYMWQAVGGGGGK